MLMAEQEIEHDGARRGATDPDRGEGEGGVARAGRRARHRLPRREPRLRRQPRPARHHDGDGAPAGDGADRSFRLRQVDAPALHQPDERPDRRRPGLGRRAREGHRRQRPDDGRDRDAAPGRDGVPEVEPVPEVDLRERRLRPADRRHQRQGSPRQRRASAASGRRRSGTRSRTASTRAGSRSPAGRCSGSASRARSRSSPRSC